MQQVQQSDITWFQLTAKAFDFFMNEAKTGIKRANEQFL